LVLGKGEFADGGELLERGREKGEGKHPARGFIGGRCVEKRKESGADWPLAKRARWLAMRGCTNGGQRLGRKVSPSGRRKERLGKKKGKALTRRANSAAKEGKRQRVRAADRWASSAVKGKRVAKAERVRRKGRSGHSAS